MCGRLVMSSMPSDFVDYCNSIDIARRIKIENAFKESFIPKFNVAPGSKIYAIAHNENDGNFEVKKFDWGLVPHWAKDSSFGAKCFNARAETMAEKPTFRDAFKRSRCVILADGYYEWKKVHSGGTGITKQPYFIHYSDAKPMFFAGLCEPKTNSATIVTRDAQGSLRQIHDRRPVFLDADGVVDWLDDTTAKSDLVDLVLSSDDKDIEAYQVSTLVNKGTVEGESLIEKVGTLFK
jgi:putative SOS response-associated peptidase YedK